MGKIRNSKGFTLVELAVVIVIISVLAAFAVPRFRDAVERSKASEAFNYLSAIQTAQERFHSRHGTYSGDLVALDIKMNAPKYFSTGNVQAGSSGNLKDSWTMTLTRKEASAGYGAYTVTFSQDGYDSANSTIQSLETINPMAS